MIARLREQQSRAYKMYYNVDVYLESMSRSYRKSVYGRVFAW